MKKTYLIVGLLIWNLNARIYPFHFLSFSPSPSMPVSSSDKYDKESRVPPSLQSPQSYPDETQADEIIYNPETQQLLVVSWEYHPGIAGYEIPADILADLPWQYLEAQFAKGWIAREIKIANGVDERSYRESYQDISSGKDIRGFFQHSYIFEYQYRKDESGEFKLYLDVVDVDFSTNTITISEQIPLIKRNIDISGIQAPETLIDILIYESDASRREQILERLSRIGNVSYINLGRTIIELLYSEYSDAEQFLAKLEESKDVALDIGQPIIPLLIEALRTAGTSVSPRDYMNFFQVTDSEVSIRSAIRQCSSEDERGRFFKRSLFSLLGDIGGVSSLPLFFEEIENGEESGGIIRDLVTL